MPNCLYIFYPKVSRVGWPLKFLFGKTWKISDKFLLPASARESISDLSHATLHHGIGFQILQICCHLSSPSIEIWDRLGQQVSQLGGFECCRKWVLLGRFGYWRKSGIDWLTYFSYNIPLQHCSSHVFSTFHITYSFPIEIFFLFITASGYCAKSHTFSAFHFGMEGNWRNRLTYFSRIRRVNIFPQHGIFW